MDRLTSDLRNPITAVVTRRQLFKGAAITFAALAVSSANPLGQSTAYAAATLQGLTDVDIVNFALTLEHLEAEFYTMAVAGGTLSGDALTTLTAIRDHEVAHVDALTKVVTQLGGTPVAKQATYNFGDMSSQANILKTAETLEAVGVGAYTGAAALITDKKNILPAAASIEQIESRHYASIRYLNGADGAPDALGPKKTVDEVKAAVKPILGN